MTNSPENGGRGCLRRRDTPDWQSCSPGRPRPVTGSSGTALLTSSLRELSEGAMADLPLVGGHDRRGGEGGQTASAALGDAMVLPALTDVGEEEDVAITLPPLPPARLPEGLRPLWARPRWWAAAAAVLVAGTALTAVLIPRGRDDGREVAETRQAPPAELPVASPPAPIQPAAPRPVVVATLTGAVDSAWGDAPFPMAAGTPITAAQRLTLSRGFAELTFENGAKVVVEAPAVFVADSRSALSLDAGRLAATAPASARGFTVRTPGANVVDLGTQFGVAVDPAAGATEVQVFDGQVQAAPRVGGAVATTLLNAGDAGRVTADAVTVTPDAASPQAFVRRLRTDVTALDVADLVSGGDGTTARREAGIVGAAPAPGDTFRRRGRLDRGGRHLRPQRGDQGRRGRAHVQLPRDRLGVESSRLDGGNATGRGTRFAAEGPDGRRRLHGPGPWDVVHEQQHGRDLRPGRRPQAVPGAVSLALPVRPRQQPPARPGAAADTFVLVDGALQASSGSGSGPARIRSRWTCRWRRRTGS